MSSVQGSVSEGTEAAALKIVAVGCAIPCTPTLVHPDYGAWHRSVLNCSFFYIKKTFFLSFLLFLFSLHR